MKILCTPSYEEQLQGILSNLVSEDFNAARQFKMYLDTIIINMPTKAQKYKPSLFFEDENIRDIDHQGFLIPFYMNEANQTYLLLGIIKK
ncbi:type II toxin-antitoxin system RelE/ParE family toxin [Sulfurimonas sp.]